LNVKDAINQRRAYRSFDPIEITNDLILELARVAQIAPSCLNSQPWQFVFIYGKENIEKILPVFSKKNQVWIKYASLMIAVISKLNNDCILGEREYYLFDTGLASAFIVLRATELGLVSHPIAGFNEAKAKQLLKIPDDMRLITFINIGKKSDIINPDLSEPQKLGEKQRPPRKSLPEFVFINQYGDAINE